MSKKLQIINILTNWLIINEDHDRAAADAMIDILKLWSDINEVYKAMDHLNSMSVTRQKIEDYINKQNIE